MKPMTVKRKQSEWPWYTIMAIFWIYFLGQVVRIWL